MPDIAIRRLLTVDEPHIDGRLVIDGGTYPIRGVEWLLRREDVGDGPRFVCTPLGEPAAA